MDYLSNKRQIGGVDKKHVIQLYAVYTGFSTVLK